ncbi:MAG: polyprenyl synthetase family protein [Candidatus Eisenbacteria bacterium]|nr:polyprenyl synthetase family protein [Candidatus Eisenbacteria bacterium]
MAEIQVDEQAVEQARSYLSARSADVNRVLGDFWQRKRKEWSDFPAIVPGAFDAYERLTGAGKKIRAGLLCLGYDAARRADSPRPADADGVFRAAGAIEILHNAFLIHDDIVDHADLRRSAPTVHRHYATLARERFANDQEALAYGSAVALNFGDKGQALAQELLLASRFPPEVLLDAIRLLGQVTAETVAGQLLDVEDIRLPELTERQVLRIHEYKTAHYTIMLPLLMGAMLAGASSEAQAATRRFAIPVGVAFQIQDDILGLFGEERLLGKPVDSDVREGKKTLLFVDAFAEASGADRQCLARAHGNPELDRADLDAVRRIVRESGALARSEGLARRLVAEGKSHIAAMTTDPDARRILLGLADYLIIRRT